MLFAWSLFFKRSGDCGYNLKSQTLMFTQKYKITQDKINAIITMSYLNPILDKTSKDDILALSFTPNTLKFKI